jgi:hypothetical protein
MIISAPAASTPKSCDKEADLSLKVGGSVVPIDDRSFPPVSTEGSEVVY